MKTLFVALFLSAAFSSFALDEPEVNQRTIEKFQIAFKEATDVKWYAEENYDQVYCMIKGIKTQIKYDKEGKFVSCFRMYGVDGLMKATTKHLIANILYDNFLELFIF